MTEQHENLSEKSHETPSSVHGDARSRFWSRVRAVFALLLVIGFFSGVFGSLHGSFAALDFTTLLGKFGITGDTATFVGKGGTSIRQGFLFALSLVPGIMFALGVVEVAEHLGAMRAAQRLLSPLLRPLLGLPGAAGLALITSLQSTDAGGAMTRELYDKVLISNKERSIFAAFQFSSGASITVYLTVGSALFSALDVSYLVPLGVIFFYKVAGTNIMRLYLHCCARTAQNKDEDHGC